MKKVLCAGVVIMTIITEVGILPGTVVAAAEEATTHPADLNTDWRLVLSEAIAYLAGWQQGSNPIAHAIRAAYLWQNGELYHYDAAQEAPLCWALGSVEPEGEEVEGEPGPHTLTYQAGPNGQVFGDLSQTVAHGGSGTAVVAYADIHCYFVRWSDGSVQNPRTDMNVTADISVTAEFSIETFTLTYTAGSHGQVYGILSQQVAYGADGEAVLAFADLNYHFLQWSDGSTQNPRTDTNVTEDVSVMATFVPDVPVVTSFAINSDGATTILLDVTLNSTCTTSPTQYMASESDAFTGASWAAYDTAPSFTLSYGVGTRTVYFKVQNESGESGVVSDSIFIVPNTVSVEAGTFTMGRTDSGDDEAHGNTDEDPRHSVTLGAYWLGKYEVTNKEYCDVLNWALAQGYLYSDISGAPWAGTGSIYAGNTSGARYGIVDFSSPSCNIQYSGGVFTSRTRVGLPGTTNYSMDTHPMVMVTWYGSVAYCTWLSQWQGLTPCYNMATSGWPLTVAPPESGGYRLPTEAEWERAAAWGTTLTIPPVWTHWIYSFQENTLMGKNRANYRDRAPNYVNPLGLTEWPYTSPVGWFNGAHVSPNGNVTTVNSPSPVGAYDMSGNVWEWCHDWYLDTYYSGGTMTNPLGPPTGADRVRRDGAWYSDSWGTRSARRARGNPDNGEYVIGFRVAVSVSSR